MDFNTRQKKVITATDPKILCLAAASSGKALPNSTILPTPSGPRPASEIKIGDYLFDKSGAPTKVLGVYPQGKLPSYKLTFEDGRTARSSLDHIWNVNYFNVTSFHNMTLKEIFEEGYQLGDGTPIFAVPHAEALQYEEKEFPFEPKEVATCFMNNTFKTIPEIYKYGSIQQRKDLLTGFATLYGQVKDDVLEIFDAGATSELKFLQDIAFSLGYSAVFDKNILRISEPKGWGVFITKIEKEEIEEEMTCFYVDNSDHLFLTENYIVTHNTRVLTERVRHLVQDCNVPPDQLVAITYTNMAAEEMKKRLGSIVDGCFIGTIHSYANKICLLNHIDTQSYLDEGEFDELLKKALKISRPHYLKVQHLLVDECQDLNKLEYDFINKIPTKNIFYVGDERQMIYGFKGASEENLYDVYRDVNFKKYYLVENYRNAPNIIKFAEDFLHSENQLSPPSIAVKTKSGEITKTDFSEALEELKEDKNYGSWFILARTNNEVADIQGVLTDEGIPFVTFKKADLYLDELDEIMAGDRVKVLTIHSCMAADTLVPTTDGLMTIKEIVEKKDFNNLVYNGTYYDRVKEFIDNGTELTYLLKSKNGSTIRLTENHDVIVLTSQGLKKVKVKDLRGGENLLIRKNITNYSSKEIELEQVKDDEVYHNVIHYPCPETLSKELAELVGMITADGTRNEVSIHYVKRYKECVERFAELVKICFNKEIEVKKASYEDAWFAECNSRFITTYLYKNFDGIGNNNKFVSSKILQSSQEIQCSFLKGFFEDGTVALKKGRVDSVTLTFKNPAIKTQLQTMLYSLGIDCSFTTHDYKNKPLSYCYIYSTGLNAFRDKIGFISNFKKERLNGFEQKYDRRNKSSACREILLNHKDELYITGQSKFWTNLLKNQSLTSSTFFKYYELLSSEQKQKDYIILIKEIFENYIIEDLASVEPYKEELTYCLTMTHESQFIQNGFLMGNSKGLEASNVIVVGARRYNKEERRISYVAATRAKQRLFWCPSFSKRTRKVIDDKKVKDKRATFFDKTTRDIISFD